MCRKANDLKHSNVSRRLDSGVVMSRLGSIDFHEEFEWNLHYKRLH